MEVKGEAPRVFLVTGHSNLVSGDVLSFRLKLIFDLYFEKSHTTAF